MASEKSFILFFRFVFNQQTFSNITILVTPQPRQQLQWTRETLEKTTNAKHEAGKLQDISLARSFTVAHALTNMSVNGFLAGGFFACRKLFFTSVRSGSSAASSMRQGTSDSSNRHKCCLCNKVFPSESVLRLHLGRRHVAAVAFRLRQRPRETYTKILEEEPKAKQPSTKELRFSGGMIVGLDGANHGNWYSFTRGVGGGPIRAIQEFRGLSFPAAVDFAVKSLLGDVGVRELASLPSSSSSFLTNSSRDGEEDVNRKLTCVNSIWKQTTAMKGTLAEKYLVDHRGILPEVIDSERLRYRFLPPGTDYLDVTMNGQLKPKTNTVPALVVPVRNAGGDLTGLQRIYLDPRTGGRPVLGPNSGLRQHKFSKGLIRGSAGLVQRGHFGGKVLVVEGPETGAAVACAAPDETVLASLSVANLNQMTDVIVSHAPDKVILAADNDVNKAVKGQTENAFLTLQEELKQYEIPISLIFPEGRDHRKSADWNDVLLERGIPEIRAQLRL